MATDWRNVFIFRYNVGSATLLTLLATHPYPGACNRPILAVFCSSYFATTDSKMAAEKRERPHVSAKFYFPGFQWGKGTPSQSPAKRVEYL